ncbi:hypothetical protein [Acidisoma sp. S159]|uniref:hypothetical protein n=1 Tax=Acidisoma sp. S159 TaxID=1747225 RepID=UPI00131CAF70|nr:hypothetical protein [Acidisoma sp. S159]
MSNESRLDDLRLLFHVYDGEVVRIAFNVAPVCGLDCGLLATGMSSLHSQLASQGLNRNER